VSDWTVAMSREGRLRVALGGMLTARVGDGLIAEYDGWGTIRIFAEGEGDLPQRELHLDRHRLGAFMAVIEAAEQGLIASRGRPHDE
jgi:hypothetical protein